ncbi:MAG: glycosyltransferase [Pararhodobacter sp.]|nr:glycosyltransferase [Pararhodobacter sp.]
MTKRFTIVTPSFNQADFLQQTLDSITAQTLKDYEHLIFDPGSTDGSLNIAAAYCKVNNHATLFEGRDKSQTHAINLGWGEAKGEILCWLNSDDRYASDDVLTTVAAEFDRNPNVGVIYGRGVFVDPEGKKLKDAYVHRNGEAVQAAFANSLGILQPSLFLRKSVFMAAGPLDESMNYSFDYEYWARCAALGVRFKFLDKVISEAVIHEDAKTMRARRVSLAESAVVGKRYYDFLSLDWVKRIVDEKESGADGITSQSTTVPEEKIRDHFIANNSNARALAHFFNNDVTMNEATRKAFVDWILPNLNRIAVSAWDSNYFDMGVTLVASIHRHDPELLLMVCDIGMTTAQRAFLTQLRNVVLLERDFPSYVADWQRNPKNYVFKNVLFTTLADRLTEDTHLLWIDAGVSLCRSPRTIFDRIEAEGHFFINHDDSRHWPLFNASFTSDAAIQVARFTWREMAGPHVCSCLFGLKIGSPSHSVFDEAARLAQTKDVAVGDKHPPDSEKRQSLPKQEQRKMAASFEQEFKPVDDLGTLRRVFGYYGHRQDQSIISALVTRHGLQISSAREFCPASDASSTVSKENWFDGISKKLGDFRPDDFNPGGVTFHHRGLVKDFSGLRFDFSRQQICAILGNGPSLAEIDFSAFKQTDSIGMNAAYRYWHEIRWYPTLYSCLDTVVGMSHKEAILDLVRHRRRYGIQQFLLRENLFQWLEEQGATDGVVNFDLIRSGLPELHPEPVTTGSHSLAWAAAIGYERFIIAGVDCNYVEQVDGSRLAADNTVEIVEEDQNPNYFFAGYQKVGDRYNIPNPSKDLHIRSWRNVGAAMANDKAALNVSSVSKVDAFPKMPLDVALNLLSADGVLDSRVLYTFTSLLAEVSQPKNTSQTKVPEEEQLQTNEPDDFRLLRRLSAELLLAPKETLAKLETDEFQRRKIRSILDGLSENDTLRRHFSQVIAFSKDSENVNKL